MKRNAPPLHQEVAIRTISVSLLAVAAVAASVLLTRSRQTRPALENVQVNRVQDQEVVSLDALRQAGF